MPTTASFRIPGRFHPGYAPLGIFIRRLTDDRWQADALYLVTVTLGSTMLLLVYLLVWNLAPGAFPHTTGEFALHAGFVLILAAVSLIGWQPPVTITCDGEGLRLQQGKRECRMAPTELEGIEMVRARRYHRHERRYAGTRVFVNRTPDAVLLVRTADWVAAIGLPEPDRTALRQRLEARCLSSEETTDEREARLQVSK